MQLITWHSRFVLGIEQLDQHHRHLLSLLNSLYDDFVHQAPAERLHDLFGELNNYTVFHFIAEETLMQACGYPDLAAHKRQHDRFTFRLNGLESRFARGSRLISFELLTFLNTWMLSHILDSDKEFGRFVVQKNRLAI